jgi:hypothetical protein
LGTFGAAQRGVQITEPIDEAITVQRLGCTGDPLGQKRDTSAGEIDGEIFGGLRVAVGSEYVVD